MSSLLVYKRWFWTHYSVNIDYIFIFGVNYFVSVPVEVHLPCLKMFLSNSSPNTISIFIFCVLHLALLVFLVHKCLWVESTHFILSYMSVLSIKHTDNFKKMKIFLVKKFHILARDFFRFTGMVGVLVMKHCHLDISVLSHMIRDAQVWELHGFFFFRR